MANAYSKEKLMMMLEEIQEELDTLDSTLSQSRNETMQRVKDHMISLSEIENKMNRLEEKIAVTEIATSKAHSLFSRQAPLSLNLAK